MKQSSLRHFCSSKSLLSHTPVSNPINSCFTKLDYGSISTLVCLGFPFWGEQMSAFCLPGKSSITQHCCVTWRLDESLKHSVSQYHLKSSSKEALSPGCKETVLAYTPNAGAIGSSGLLLSSHILLLIL